jgi:hypothetical protein
MSERRKALAWEARWSLPTAIASFSAVTFIVAAFIVGKSLGGGGEAAELREIHDHGGILALASAMQALGFALLLVPLFYLFRAALARSDRMRSQFKALVVAAPLALAVASVLSGVAANQAASDFAAGKASATLSVREATSECRSERKDDAAGFSEEFGKGGSAVSDCAAEKRKDDAATNASKDTSLYAPSQLLQIAGFLAFAFTLAYSCLWAMRAGLLTRFWGSLEIALAVSQLLIPPFSYVTLLWFIYFGLLAGGWLPGGRPPAWAAGEPIPWPSPGEKAATQLSPSEEPDESEEPPDKGQSQ